MAAKVVVRDINGLDGYCRRLISLKSELETNAEKLVGLAEELNTKASAMSSATDSQGENWQDPQYEKLKEEITPCVTSINATSVSVKETAATIKKQMAQVQVSIAYLQKLLVNLKEIF